MKQGYFNTADSAHLYYEVRGNGRPLVLVHGWQCSHLFWQRNVDELAKDFTVVTLDLRGAIRPKGCMALPSGSLPATCTI